MRSSACCGETACVEQAGPNFYDDMVLADTAFSSIEFLQTVRRKKLPALVGAPRNRCLQNGRKVEQLHKSGQQVYLKRLPFPVTVAHYYLQREDGIK